MLGQMERSNALWQESNEEQARRTNVFIELINVHKRRHGENEMQPYPPRLQNEQVVDEAWSVWWCVLGEQGGGVLRGRMVMREGGDDAFIHVSCY